MSEVTDRGGGVGLYEEAAETRAIHSSIRSEVQESQLHAS
jgi:hypothetical protein